MGVTHTSNRVNIGQDTVSGMLKLLQPVIMLKLTYDVFCIEHVRV